MSSADAIFTTTLQQFLSTISPRNGEPSDDLSPLVLASIVERLAQNPPQNWGEEQRENLAYAMTMRYRSLQVRMPPTIQSSLYLHELLGSQDSRLAKHIQRTGLRGTASIEACKEMLAGVETRDISYLQIANAMLFMVIAQNGEVYDPAMFVTGLRQHRAGPKIDWTDVVQCFDRPGLSITKKQFLGLYNALLPLAKEYVNFDIQTLWGGQWQAADTQLSFVVAFLSTTPDELDVTQIPGLRQAFTLEDYEGASASVKQYAAEAVKHPLVSQDATEALFVMIFRWQEAYTMAQMLGIPDMLINPNMPIFVCAASAVPKPWGPLQDQALKQLFYPFVLKQHNHDDFVMYSMWLHDKAWTASKIVDFYTQDNMLLPAILAHAVENGWLESLLTISSGFAVDLATFAHGKGECDLIEWSRPHMAQMGNVNYGRALEEFLHNKMEDEGLVQREKVAPTTTRLALKTLHTLLRILDGIGGDNGPLFRLCLALYPRLFNFGEDEARDALLEASCERGHLLSEVAGTQMEERYKAMYGNESTPDQVVAELTKIKVSSNAGEQELFASMLHGLFDEYNCFGEYPQEALATTAVLFGGLLQFKVISGLAEGAAINMIFEAVSSSRPDDPMYKFGLQAMVHLLGRLKDWPALARKIIDEPSLVGTQANIAAESALKDLQHDSIDLNGDGVNGITNGALDDEFPVDSPTPPFSGVHADSPTRADFYEEPNEEVSDKVIFVLNNLSNRNLEEKFHDLEGALDEKYHQWFAHYLVEELAKSQPNFQALYLQLLDSFDRKVLWAEVLRETYASCEKMLNAQSTMESPSERTNLKNLAGWLGSLTLARNQPILYRNLSFKDLLVEGHDTERLLVAIPFTCKALSHVANSKIFKPPNPWIMELLGLLSELYHCFNLKLNMKFEIEVLCNALEMDVKTIEPAEIIRARPLAHESSMMQQYAPDGADGFTDMHIMGLSKRAHNERFSSEAVVQALPDLVNMLQIPQAAGNVTQSQLRTIFVQAAQRAIYEIIAPVVERSVTIAAISTAELIQKDFATEADTEKLRSSAYTVVKALSGSLALVTCKEPLRMSIMNNIRIMAMNSLSEQLPEGQIIMFVNDNIDTVCSLVEQAAEEHSLAEIDAQLVSAIDLRRQHNEQRPNEPFNNPLVSRWAQLIPEPFRQDPQGGNASGLNRQQLGLYEEFGRQARITPAAHSSSMSLDAGRQLPDVLSEGFLPSMPTPVDAPAIPRPTPQQQRMQVMQQGQHQVNGYMDTPNIGQQILELMRDLQQAAREAPEAQIREIGEGAPTRRLYDELIQLITSTMQKDTLAMAASQQCFMIIYGETRKRLEVEVFVRLLAHLCRMSGPTFRHYTMFLANNDDETLFKADATVALLGEDLLQVEQVDVQTAKALRAKRVIVLDFLKDLLHDVLLGEDPIALRSDFVLTYEALSQWLVDDPDNEDAIELLEKLQMNKQANGMPSPAQSEKHDQLEYIFEEWIRLQRKGTPERSIWAFLQQLNEQHIVSDSNGSVAFFRACIEISCTAYERVTAVPYATQDAAYIHVDALAKLFAYLVIYQSDIDDRPEASKSKSLDTVLKLIILIMNDQQKKQPDTWNARVYFRLFSSLVCEMHAGRAQLGAQQEVEVYRVFGVMLEILQHYDGFIFAWLALLSHRLLVPAYLAGAARTNGGWTIYSGLITVLFHQLDRILAMPDPTTDVPNFYRGVLRFLLMLHHDFPEYLTENHVLLNSAVPTGCAQIHNIINSAATRAIMAEQPDPFTTGLKINRMEMVRQSPASTDMYQKALANAGIKETVERVSHSASPSSADYGAITQALASTEFPPTLVANALVLALGVSGTPTSSVFSSAAPPSRLIEHLARTLPPATRYTLLSAIMNQIRHVNAHTHYFSTCLVHLFTTSTDKDDALQEAIMRLIVERLMVPRPHPWGVLALVLELLKNPAIKIWELDWMRGAPEVRSMLMSVAGNGQEMRRAS